jgi:hypothetical protein
VVKDDGGAVNPNGTMTFARAGAARHARAVLVGLAALLFPSIVLGLVWQAVYDSPSFEAVWLLGFFGSSWLGAYFYVLALAPKGPIRPDVRAGGCHRC